MTSIELIGTVFGLACVILCVRQSIWNWPVGLVQVAMYAWIFYHARLYSDFVLHLIYIALQIYGWISWQRGRRSGGSGDDESLPVTRLTVGGLAMWLIASGTATIVIGYAMHRYAGAAIPYGDAAILVLSLVAQFLLARKVLETWAFWIVVDVLALGVYTAKELYITTGLYAVFLVLAILGWQQWRRSFRQQQQQQQRQFPNAKAIPATQASAPAAV